MVGTREYIYRIAYWMINDLLLLIRPFWFLITFTPKCEQFFVHFDRVCVCVLCFFQLFFIFRMLRAAKEKQLRTNCIKYVHRTAFCTLSSYKFHLFLFLLHLFSSHSLYLRTSQLIYNFKKIKPKNCARTILL